MLSSWIQHPTFSLSLPSEKIDRMLHTQAAELAISNIIQTETGNKTMDKSPNTVFGLTSGLV
jgi:hypothetical protein